VFALVTGGKRVIFGGEIGETQRKGRGDLICCYYKRKKERPRGGLHEGTREKQGGGARLSTGVKGRSGTRGIMGSRLLRGGDGANCQTRGVPLDCLEEKQVAEDVRPLPALGALLSSLENILRVRYLISIRKK